MTKLPQRRTLPHNVPSWVAQGARHFITINCTERHTSPLRQSTIASQLLESARFYEETDHWYLWLMLVMPDHVHFIASFDLNRGVKNTVSAWKHYQTHNLNISWQRDFFEHSLRNDEEFREKACYIRMNPVRKGLVTTPEQWPHLIDRTALEVMNDDPN